MLPGSGIEAHHLHIPHIYFWFRGAFVGNRSLATLRGIRLKREILHAQYGFQCHRSLHGIFVIRGSKRGQRMEECADEELESFMV